MENSHPCSHIFFFMFVCNFVSSFARFFHLFWFLLLFSFFPRRLFSYGTRGRKKTSCVFSFDSLLRATLFRLFRDRLSACKVFLVLKSACNRRLYEFFVEEAPDEFYAFALVLLSQSSRGKCLTRRFVFMPATLADISHSNMDSI